MSYSSNRILHLHDEIDAIRTRLTSLPEGDLRCHINASRTKWYLYERKHLTYLPKENRDLAQKLTLRKYLEARLKEDEQELRLLLSAGKWNTTPRASDEMLTDPRYADLLPPQLTGVAAHRQLWMTADYPKNPYKPEKLIHKTAAGYNVRSKSESLIALLLHQNHIPHRYECQLDLNGRSIYPDFTIMHPQTSDLYYWEHLGLLSDPDYRRDAVRKCNDYFNAGIYPGLRLILTSETEDCPLGYDTVMAIIDQYFL